MISPLLISKTSSFKPVCVTVQAGLYWTWSKTPKTGSLASQLLSKSRMTTLNIFLLLYIPGSKNRCEARTSGWLGERS